MIGLASPLLDGEFVKDPDKRWKYTRLAILLTAAASEALWATRVQRERDECREDLRHDAR